jgi:hypothetical protein
MTAKNTIINSVPASWGRTGNAGDGCDAVTDGTHAGSQCQYGSQIGKPDPAAGFRFRVPEPCRRLLRLVAPDVPFPQPADGRKGEQHQEVQGHDQVVRRNTGGQQVAGA